MLEDDCPAVRNAALRVLKRFPNAHALDKLWDLHRVNHGRYVQKNGDRYWVAYGESFSALRSCVRLETEWLRRLILNSHADDQPFEELAYLVANLPGSYGRQFWLEVKSELFAKVPTDKPRCLVTCIQEHGDRAELPRLEKWLGQDADLCGPVAFSAIVYLDPKRALSLLPQRDSNKLYFSRGWWLPTLLVQLPSETRQQIRALIEDRPAPRWRTSLVYQSDPNQMGEATVNILLDELEALLIDATSSDQGLALHGPLGLLADITRLSLLAQFEARAGTPLELHLADHACVFAGRMTEFVDHELEPAIQVLTRIAGEGLTQVANALLAAENKHVRLKGCRLSPIRADSNTRRRLIDLSQSVEHWSEEVKQPLLQAEATVSLAALGEDRAVVDSILRWGLVLRRLPDARRGQPPMKDSDISAAIEALENSDQEIKTHAVRALSVSGRTDLAPRIRRILAEAEPESELALSAVVALDHFEDTGQEAAKLLEVQVKIPGHTHAASLALLRNGRKESIGILEEQLRTIGISSGLVQSDLLAVNLAMRAETRKTVAEVLWNSILRSQGSLGMNAPLDCLAEIDSPEVREYLIQEAHAPDRGIHVVGQKASAIRALAKLDPDAAFRAAKIALRADVKDRELYPNVLVEVDEARAVAALFESCTLDQLTLVKWAIGRALRRVRDPALVLPWLDRLMKSEDPEARAIAVEMAGWQPPTDSSINRVRQIAISDPARDVRRAAEKAIQFLDHQQTALELLGAFKEAGGSRAWSYLAAIVKVCDPLLLTTQNDPLSIWASLVEKAPSLQHFASELIEKRQAELKSEAQKADRQNRQR